jgi:hypothetical protein
MLYKPLKFYDLIEFGFPNKLVKRIRETAS